MRDTLTYALLLLSFSVLMLAAMFWGHRGVWDKFVVFLSGGCMVLLGFMLLAVSRRLERKFDHLEEVIRESLTASRVADPEHDAQTDPSADAM